MTVLYLLLSFVLITAALTIICYFVGDENWLHAFFYVLGCYAVLAMFGFGIMFLVWGTS